VKKHAPLKEVEIDNSDGIVFSIEDVPEMKVPVNDTTRQSVLDVSEPRTNKVQDVLRSCNYRQMFGLCPRFHPVEVAEQKRVVWMVTVRERDGRTIDHRRPEAVHPTYHPANFNPALY
tara:strand:+ start:1039 stop:1392 length:354 start_codon:yes stop_codon:yes gene_type:complete